MSDRRLLDAVYDNDLREVDRLIMGGANVNEIVSGANNGTPLGCAAMKDLPEAAQILIDNGADLDQDDGFGRTPLMAAISHSSHRVASLLISKGADVNATWGKATPLSKAVENGAPAIMIEHLLQHGASINISVDDFSLLEFADLRIRHGVLDAEIPVLLRRYGAK